MLEEFTCFIEQKSKMADIFRVEFFLLRVYSFCFSQINFQPFLKNITILNLH
jgi:hypothetical protein